MPPEMITTVAPIAMIAKKLASVAVWMSVCEFQKLLTVTPVARSTCEPASSVSVTATSASTTTSPVSCEPTIRRAAARMQRGEGYGLADRITQSTKLHPDAPRHKTRGSAR